MANRKAICFYCNKIADLDTHSCKGMDKKKEHYNATKRDYYRKNKETLKPLMSRRWSKFRLHIISRDDSLCQRCLIKYNIINGADLQVHHIKSRIHFPELIYDENNVITLCQTCNVQLGISDKLDFKWEKPERDFLL